MGSSYSRQQLESWLKTIKLKGGKVLDVGGSQNPISKSRLKIFEPDEYKILDLEQPHECKQIPDLIWDINEFLPDAIYRQKFNDIKQSFDTVFCLEVSEYWWNPYQAIKNIDCLLKKDGILYISFHYVYPIHSPKGYDHLRYTPYGAEKLLKEIGFEIIEHKKRLATNKYLKMYYEYDKMRGLKNNFNHNIIGSFIKAKKL